MEPHGIRCVMAATLAALLAISHASPISDEAGLPGTQIAVLDMANSVLDSVTTTQVIGDLDVRHYTLSSETTNYQAYPMTAASASLQSCSTVTTYTSTLPNQVCICASTLDYCLVPTSTSCFDALPSASEKTTTVAWTGHVTTTTTTVKDGTTVVVVETPTSHSTHGGGAIRTTTVPWTGTETTRYTTEASGRTVVVVETPATHAAKTTTVPWTGPRTSTYTTVIDGTTEVVVETPTPNAIRTTTIPWGGSRTKTYTTKVGSTTEVVIETPFADKRKTTTVPWTGSTTSTYTTIADGTTEVVIETPSANKLKMKTIPWTGSRTTTYTTVDHGTSEIVVETPSVRIKTTTVPWTGRKTTTYTTAAHGATEVVVETPTVHARTTTVAWTGTITTLYTTAVSGTTEVFVETPAPSPFSCDPYGYLIQYNSLYRVDLSSGDVKLVSNSVDKASSGANALGYNVQDNSLYGRDQEGRVLRIGADGSSSTITTLSTDANANVGDVDTSGHYWFSSSGNNYYQLDLNPSSATYAKVITHGETDPLGLTIADWVYLPLGGRYLYSIGTNTTSGGTSLARFSMASYKWESIANYPSVTARAWGAQYGINNGTAGTLYASDNGSGDIWAFPASGSQPRLVSKGRSSTNNDGARCVLNLLG